VSKPPTTKFPKPSAFAGLDAAARQQWIHMARDMMQYRDTNAWVSMRALQFTLALGAFLLVAMGLLLINVTSDVAQLRNDVQRVAK